MTVAETYEYLYRVRNIDKQIKRMRAEQDALRMCLLPSGIRYDADKVQTSPSDQMLEVESKVDEIDHEIISLLEERSTHVVDATRTINLIGNETEQTVLIDYFLAGMTVKKIAEHIAYTRESTYKVMKRGVIKLSDIL